MFIKINKMFLFDKSIIKNKKFTEQKNKPKIVKVKT